MGAGKSTHGKKLAKTISFPFIDLDHYIEKKEEKSIEAIFNSKGEATFRDLESMYLNQVISRYTKAVFSLGGGTPCFNSNMDVLLKNGLVIYIQMSPEALNSRLIESKATRPLLENKSKEEALEFIKKLLGEREGFYSRAHVTVNGINLTADKLKESIIDFSQTS